MCVCVCVCVCVFWDLYVISISSSKLVTRSTPFPNQRPPFLVPSCVLCAFTNNSLLPTVNH